ncbi:hypothetical protein KKF91_01155 [Myxococcota bacterium]|nr:hypothetical protein [Myxococcota bacterium]MBU1429143.1 hypothetical protein [Myxococcota bacterium]MBU1900696.1 hypothetical protein [Myxococcota bacterium]
MRRACPHLAFICVAALGCADVPQNSARDAQNPARDAQNPARDAQNPARDAQNPARDAQNPARDAQNPERDAQNPERDAQNPARDAQNPAQDAQNPDSGYPPGPYGLRVGEIIADLVFARAAGPVTLSDLRAHHRLLLLLTAAGWCRTCAANTERLVSWSTRPDLAGLGPVVVLFQDADFQPPSPSYADAWAARFETPYPVVTDAAFQLGAYLNPAQESMALIIDAASMRILSSKGFDPALTEAEVLRQLDALR